MTIYESGEMYLETILRLKEKNPNVRSIDVASEMGFSKASVSRALHKLEEGGYLIMDDNGFLRLTDQGTKVAETIYERHTVISGLLMSIGVPEETATEDACRVEHVISAESFDAIKRYIASRK